MAALVQLRHDSGPTCGASSPPDGVAADGMRALGRLTLIGTTARLGARPLGSGQMRAFTCSPTCGQMSMVMPS